MNSIRARTALATVVTALLGATSANAQPAPYRNWHTLDTPHFHVHVAEGMEREGRVAGAAAERAYALLARELVEPRGPIDLVVSDDADYSNGFATPFPTNRIVIFATPPIEAGGLGLSEDWIALVVTHELTHIFHLDRTRGIWATAQHVFGRAPLLFPNVYSPSWLTEGLAVYYESRLTAGGRLRSAEHRTIARAAAQEDLLPQLGDISTGTPRFPGGESVYAYGSLFLEYLAATRGDSSVPRFVERQSGALIPVLQERAAKDAFGITLARAFAAWRDSVQHEARGAERPLADWHELTARSFAAQSPRWLDDTTLVYTASDGRSSTAAFTITIGGRRTRLGRRSSNGENVPLPGGGLLFAQPEYVGTSEVRSDLYVERDGVQTRLTHGARLIQPDVSGDGRIVAVELAAGRSSLVLLDAEGGGRSVLRDGGPDETWSEPRWAPDGRRVLAVHRVHGGGYRLEQLDLVGGQACTMASAEAIIASPDWVTTRVVIYTSERSGAPQVEAVSACGRPPTVLTRAPSGVAAVEVNVRTHRLAAVVLRADGYHLGAGSADLPRGRPADERVVASAAPALADTEALAPGTYGAYQVLRGLAPHYWLPLLEAGVGGTRFGAMTSGRDVVGRHAFDAYVGVQASGRFATGNVDYSYAGLRRATLSVSASQDWITLGQLVDTAGAARGEVERRIQDLSVAATFVRPRYRTYAAITAGLGVERRRFATDPASRFPAIDPTLQRDYTYPRAFVGASWSDAQQPLLSISREDGVSLGLTARERLRTDDASGTISTSVVGTAAGYKSLDLPGFAHHVLALRLAGGVADHRTTTSLEVGGTSGGTLDIVPGVTVGEGRRTFGVRGFPAAAIYGTTAAAASLEYRAPLVLKGRGSWAIPAFFDRSSLSVFADAGTATCATGTLAGVCSRAPVIGRTIASVGGELGVSLAFLQVDVPELLRFGVAVPVAGRDLVNANVVGVAPVSAYLALGYSF